LGDWKTRLSTLWLMTAFSIVSSVLLGLFESGDLTHIMPPFAVDQWSLLLFTVGILAALVMAFLSQTLADKANRWTNIIVGAVYGILAMVALVGELVDNPSVLAINPAAGFVFSVLTIWLAWKSK
jgi:glucose uptake protein GlcU